MSGFAALVLDMVRFCSGVIRDGFAKYWLAD